jgi:hypothetical protein
MLSSLSPDQSSSLEQWLFDDSPALSYEQAKDRLELEFGVKTSVGSLYKFFERATRKRLTAKIADTTQAVQSIREQTGQPSLDVFDTLMEMGGFATLEASVRCKNPSLDQLKDIMKLAAMGMRAKNQARLTRVRERTLALHERKLKPELDRQDRLSALEQERHARFNSYTLPTRSQSPSCPGDKPGGDVLKVALNRAQPAPSTTPTLHHSNTPSTPSEILPQPQAKEDAGSAGMIMTPESYETAQRLGQIHLTKEPSEDLNLNHNQPGHLQNSTTPSLHDSVATAGVSTGPGTAVLPTQHDRRSKIVIPKLQPRLPPADPSPKNSTTPILHDSAAATPSDPHPPSWWQTILKKAKDEFFTTQPNPNADAPPVSPSTPAASTPNLHQSNTPSAVPPAVPPLQNSTTPMLHDSAAATRPPSAPPSPRIHKPITKSAPITRMNLTPEQAERMAAIQAGKVKRRREDVGTDGLPLNIPGVPTPGF